MKRAKSHAQSNALKHNPPPPPVFKPSLPASLARVISTFSIKAGEPQFKIGLRDVNPLSAVGSVLSSYNNVAATFLSGMLFAAQYSIAFTAVTTYASRPYAFGSILIGAVLLSFGAGNMVGSVGGGKYSDVVLSRLKAQNGGVGRPEMRIKSSLGAMICLPPVLIA